MRVTILGSIGLLCVVILTALVPSRYAQSQSLQDLIEAAKAERELNLVAGPLWVSSDSAKLIQDALNKKYNLNIRLNYVPGLAFAVMAVRLTEQHKAGAKADTDIYVGSPENMGAVLGGGWARPFPWREVFPYISEETVDLEGKAIRTVGELFGITYNTREITGKDVPHRLEDVLNPKWKGKIASTPYAAGLYILALGRVWGYEKATTFVRELSRQIGGLIRCGEEARIASGEFLMLVMNCGNFQADQYARTSGAPVGTAVLEDASLLLPFYLVVPKHAVHPNLATLLVGFLMSKEGQEVLYRGAGYSSPWVEGTPANRQIKDMKAKGTKIHEFTAANFLGEEGAVARKAYSEFQKILIGR